jgi:hypothetical protein
MSTCNFTTAINGTDNIGLSRTTINTNFSNLDTAACSLSTAIISLSSRIASGALQGAKGDNGLSFFAPTGTIIPFGGSSAPSSDWLLCDGTSYQISNYTNLYSVIGTVYNTASTQSGFFNVPNLVGKLAVGASTQLPLGAQSTVLFPAGSTNTLNYLNIRQYIKAS